jgi:hypothetical protein
VVHVSLSGPESEITFEISLEPSTKVWSRRENTLMEIPFVDVYKGIHILKIRIKLLVCFAQSLKIYVSHVSCNIWVNVLRLRKHSIWISHCVVDGDQKVVIFLFQIPDKKPDVFKLIDASLQIPENEIPTIFALAIPLFLEIIGKVV